MKDEFVLSDTVPYLLNRAGVKIGECFNREMIHFGITVPMSRVLLALWQHGDQRLRQLAEMTSIEASTLSRMMVAMEQRRLVQRQRSDNDGRALNLRLTRKGEAMTERIIPLARQYGRMAVRGLSDAEVRQLKRMLVKMYSSMEAFENEPEAAEAAE
jgi:DNA-binding MarR family transcriptional regulator